MKNNLFFVFVFFILVVAPISLAVELSVQTLPNHRISAFFREPEKLTNADSVHMDTGSGDITINSSLYNGDEMDLILTLKKDGQTILNKEFSGMSTDKIIYINFIPGLSEEEMLINNFKKPEVQNDSSVNNTNSTNNEVIEKNKIEESEKEKTNSVVVTGRSVEENENSSSLKIIYYILGAVAGIFALIFLIQTGRRKLKGYDNYKIVKYSHGEDRKFADAERKLAEAKMELDEIKNRKKKLVEAKKRFEKDKDELKNLGVKDYY